MLAVHGLNDRKAAFARFGRWARDRGLLVVAYDQRGFGEWADRGFWPGEEVLVTDLIRRTRALARTYPDVPRYLLGHSLGAAVVIAAAAREPELPVDGLVLVAPAVWGGERFPALYRLLLELAAELWPGLEVSGRRLGRRASDNDAALRELARDPHFLKTTRLATLLGTVRLMDRAWAAAPQLRGRVLVLVGARDEIVPPDAQIAFARRIAVPDCTLLVYPAGWHLLLRDLQRQRVYGDIRAWIRREVPPSGLAEPCRGSGVAPVEPKPRP